LLGGAQEAELGAYLEQHCNALPLNFCGKLNIHQSASLIQQAKAVLTHDTGLMHIAAALRKPIVSLWGSTVPAFGMYPFYPQGTDRGSMIEVKNLSCRPCSKIGYQKCPKGHFRCMYEISVPEIWEQLSKILH
jgi:ADP-heptose:LPS heptosyltransferase